MLKPISLLLLGLGVGAFSSSAQTAALQTQPSQTQSPSKAEAAIGEVFASDTSVQGSVVLAASGTSLLAGSTVDAGSAPALVKLRRGGAVRVCPGSSLSINSAQSAEAESAAAGSNRQSGLMLSLGTGAIEANYKLEAAADTLITPDFRILLSGPGAFHVAVSVDARGNTCVRTLPGNTAALVVSELMGAGSYQVKPAESVYFAGGQVAKASAETGACGCSAPAVATETAEALKPTSAVATETAQTVKPTSAAPAISAENTAAPVANPATPPVPVINTSSETQPVPAAKPGEVQVQVDAPFVFRAADPGPSTQTVASIPLKQGPDIPQPEVLAPEPVAAAQASVPVTNAAGTKKKTRKGFFGRLRGFFVAVFG